MGQIFQIICHLKKTKLEYVFISYVSRFNFKTSFTPVNTDMFTVMGPSPGKDNVSFSFTFLISLNLFPSAVYITMIAYCKCSRFMWLLALSSLGKGKREDVSFCRSQKWFCAWTPILRTVFPFLHSACCGDILYLPRSAAFQASLRFPVGIGEVFTFHTLSKLF